VTRIGSGGDRDWGWAFEEAGAVGLRDDERAGSLTANDLDDPAVDVFVVPVAEEHQVVDVRRSLRPRDDVVGLAPSWFSFAAGNDAASVSHVEHSTLSVTGGVGDLAEIERDGSARNNQRATTCAKSSTSSPLA